MTTAADIEETLLAMADERQACQLLRFFKTGPGEYGEGDRFIGLRNPQVRLVVKEAWKSTPLSDTLLLLKSPFHEVRLCALLIMVEKYLRAMKSADTPLMSEIFNLYTTQHPHINNWDLVDLSAPKIVGNHEALNPHIALMEQWIKPGHTLWQQRISMVSTWTLTRHHKPQIALRRAEYMLDSTHDLLHKAAGWMLREVWKRGYQHEVRQFLDRHITRFPSVMLSYTCEQMHPDERRHWQQKRKER